MNTTRNLIITASALLGAVSAQAEIIDFEEFVQGEIVSGMQIKDAFLTVDNLNTAVDLAVVIDTQVFSSVDADLTGPPWAGGNLAADNTVLGNAIIIQEVDANFAGYTDANQTHVILPDDEGRRPAGSFFFDFDAPLVAFGFDMIDIEGIEEYDDFSGYVMVFTGVANNNARGLETRTVSFAEFVDPNSIFYDPTVAFGNNFANRIQPLTAEQLDLNSFTSVEVSLGGSGALDNINYTVIPEPGSVVLLGLAGLALVRRRRA